METKAKPTTLIITLLFIIITFSCLVHSRNLASSPSPAPVSEEPVASNPNLLMRRNGKVMRGSFPATCHSKCNQCMPCMPVEVSVRTMEWEENEYYPQVWKCMCQNNMFSP